jgi:hypothetical protein
MSRGQKENDEHALDIVLHLSDLFVSASLNFSIRRIVAFSQG